MSCVLEYNQIARSVAAEVGDIIIEDLYSYVEDFCSSWPLEPASSGYGNNYTSCAIQTMKTGLHFFTAAPLPSGQQYTALSVAETAIRHLPESQIDNSGEAPSDSIFDAMPHQTDPFGLGSCGEPPAALNKRYATFPESIQSLCH